MSEDNDYILKYFFLYGISEEIKDKLKFNYFNKNNTLTPKVLSSYSAEGKTDLFISLQEKLDNDDYLKNNIFPKNSSFFDEINFRPDIKEPLIDIKLNYFNQYISEVNNFSEKKNFFFHCFQSFFPLDQNGLNNILLNFGVLIFYENVTNEIELFEEKEKSWVAFFWKSQYSNIYVPKALILISDKPIFSLMKEILEKIYIQINKKFTYFPLEKIIINIFDIINDEENPKNKYKIIKEPLVPYCDLNLNFFFNCFNMKDIFLLAEYYLCSKTIILASNKIEFLFPIYYIFMTLFFPLNINDIKTFYKLAVPIKDTLERTLFCEESFFQLIYLDKKLDSNFLDKICEIKGDIIVYQILHDTQNEKENVFFVEKNIYKYEDKEGKNFVKKINVEEYETIIEKVCKTNFDVYDYLIPLIQKDIEELKYDEDYKRPTFFMKNFEKKYESLRNHLMSLFIKFFVMRLEPLEIEKYDEFKIQIKSIKFKPLENDPSANELLDILETTQQNDLIYKNMIIETGQFDNEIMKRIILLDNFIKISYKDKKRYNFEPKVLLLIDKTIESGDLNKNTPVIKEKKDINEINNNKFNINDLFDFSDLITEEKNYFYYINRVYLYSLQNPSKTNFIIDQGRFFIKHLKYYQELTNIDRTSDINTIHDYNALKYMIFFGEKFELHFGQFVNKTKMKKEIDYNLKNSECEYISKNKNYEQYYKATLNEIEIFYDLFITQIIPVENKEELAAFAIGLYVSSYIINLMSLLKSDNNHNEKIKNILLKKQVKLYQLFVRTKAFYGKCDFLVTLLYEIISSKQIRGEKPKKFCDLFMNCLFKEKVIPSIIIILMNNHNISLDFTVIKKVIEKNMKIKKRIRNKSTVFSGSDKSFNQSNECTKEYLIYNVEKKEHEHEYNLFDDINLDYNCVEKEKCGDVLGFNIQLKEGDNPNLEFVHNPRYLIIKYLKKIVKNKSLFHFPFGDLNDIYQIVMLDELYFKIGFFRDKKNKK